MNFGVTRYKKWKLFVISHIEEKTEKYNDAITIDFLYWRPLSETFCLYK